jgi:hypothetical protein
VILLQGSVSEAAERIAVLREHFGISYFTLNLSPGTTWETSKTRRQRQIAAFGAAGVRIQRGRSPSRQGPVQALSCHQMFRG